MKQICVAILLISIFVGCKKSTAEDEYFNLGVLVLDYDARTPIANATVYPKSIWGGITDSAFSDANGRVSFRVKKDNTIYIPMGIKNNYVIPAVGRYARSGNYDRTDTVFLVKPSYINVTIHKTGIFLAQDSIAIRVKNDYFSPIFYSNDYRNLTQAKADAPDKVFNLTSWYHPVAMPKIYFQWDIIRSGSVISTQTDSTSMIQFGTKNFTLNY